MLNKVRKQRISVVFNESSITLTDSMVKVLNRGLKFAIQPLNLDITQVLVDYKRFERSVRWQEFWHNRECDETREVPRFVREGECLQGGGEGGKEAEQFVSCREAKETK